MKSLISRYTLFQKSQVFLRYIQSLSEASSKHTHDFYEIFIIMQGEMVHCINGKRKILIKGQAVLIRPGDVHYFEHHGAEDCSFLNFAFSALAMQEICRFLDNNIQPEQYLALPEPMTVELPPEMLSDAEKTYRKVCLLKPESQAADAKGRVLIVRLIEGWFLLQEEKQPCPEWFRKLEEQMTRPEIFKKDLNQLSEICGKTPEHLCRAFKKYRGTSPLQVLTSNRLSYAANLLRMSTIPILDISLECGYTSLSHFYSRFEKVYHMTPAAYRNQYRIQ